LQSAIAQFEIANIKHGLEMAKFANIPDSDALITEAVHTLSFIDSEKDLLSKLQNAFEYGGYLKTGNVIDFGTVIDIDGLTDVVTECHGFGLATKYGKDLLRKARHIMQLRIALRKALSARSNDALWNIVVAVINNSILCSDESMGDNAEVIAANQIIYIYLMRALLDRFGYLSLFFV